MSPLRFTLLIIVALAAAGFSGLGSPRTTVSPASQRPDIAAPEQTLVATNAASSSISFIDVARGTVSTLEVGDSPWGIATGPGKAIYVSTARGLAIVDSESRSLAGFFPFQTPIASSGYGEYRPGGM